MKKGNYSKMDTYSQWSSWRRHEDFFIMIDDPCCGYFQFLLIFHPPPSSATKQPLVPFLSVSPWFKFITRSSPPWAKQILLASASSSAWILKCCWEATTRKNQHKSLSKCLALPIKKTMPCNFQSLTQFNFTKAPSSAPLALLLTIVTGPSILVQAAKRRTKWWRPLLEYILAVKRRNPWINPASGR